MWRQGIWSYEGVVGAHIVFSGLCFLVAIWHWVYWDLEIFCDECTGKPSLDYPKIFGIHLFLSGVDCFGFGVEGFDPFVPGRPPPDHRNVVLAAVDTIVPASAIASATPPWHPELIRLLPI
ncbi:hypothetical protein Goshw_016500 [Gossypium schwendimanii]|uniref:Photosystem II CP47 chlorophyll apoprotein n=1 Tax=Gossypium schwendimanii TaxID=34291 RepID=A0A7J9LWB3_GOSSC|nr:hypothetical protein [Gossypium schwendimanii]